MEKNEYDEILNNTKRFAHHLSFAYTDYQDLRAHRILQNDDNAIISIGKDDEKGMYTLCWAANDAASLASAVAAIGQGVLVPFVPHDWKGTLLLDGFAEYAAYRDYWIDDIDSVDIDDAGYLLVSQGECGAVADVSVSCRGQSRGFLGTSEAWVARWMRGEEEPDMRDWAVLAARDDERIIGILCTATYAHESERGAVVWVRMVAVRPEHQGRGVGRALLKGALQYGKERGAKRAFLHADDLNEHAIGLYKSVGFKPRDDVELDLVYARPLLP